MRPNHGCFKDLFDLLLCYTYPAAQSPRVKRCRLVCLTKALIMQDRLS